MQAIVLSRRDFREFDQIVTFYSMDAGKVELLARGVKKIKSKNSAHLEPFSCVNVDLVKGKKLDHLTKVIPIYFFAKIRQNFDKTMAAGFLASLLGVITEVGERDKRLYDLFLSWLKFVDKNENFKHTLVDSFVIKLFSFLGFRPILESCVVCVKDWKTIIKKDLAQPVSTKVAPGKLAVGFYFSGGGIICPNCREDKRYAGELIVDCGLKEISNLQILLNQDWNLVSDFNMEQVEQKKLHKLIYEFVLFHSEKKIENWSFKLS